MTALAVVMSLFHLYAAYEIVPTQMLRPVHVAFVLFALFPAVFPIAHALSPPRHVVGLDSRPCSASRSSPTSSTSGDDFIDRSTPRRSDWTIVFGVALIVLVLEAIRRTPPAGSCRSSPFSSSLYALFGPYLPAPWTHKGYESRALSARMYMTLEGIFGVAIDVSSSLIILFTIFGAFLQYSGAGKFYHRLLLRGDGRQSRPAPAAPWCWRSFLLGGPSGSGVATTVTLGSVAYPMLAKVGYGKNAAGGLLAAGGLGAIISPPVLGAAAFLIAEFLKISYLDVILMAAIPTLLFYLALFLDGRDRRAQVRHAVTLPFEQLDRVWNLTKQLLVPLPVAGLDRRLHAAGASRRCCRCSGRPWSSFATSFLQPRYGAHSVRPLSTAGCRRLNGVLEFAVS